MKKKISKTKKRKAEKTLNRLIELNPLVSTLIKKLNLVPVVK